MFHTGPFLFTVFRAMLNLHKYELAIDEVLPLIGMAEILSPTELREYVASKLSMLAGSYMKEA